MIITPLRLDRVQESLVSVFDTAVGSPVTHWSYTEPSEEQLPESFITLTMIAGPGPFQSQSKRGTVLDPIDSVDIAIDSVIIGKRYGVLLNGFNFFTDSVGGDTVDTIRDRLVTAINESAETATAAAGGPGELSIVSNFLGGIWSLAIYGPLTSSNVVKNDNSVLVTSGSQIMTVNVQAYSVNSEPRNGAWSLLQTCLAALQTESYAETLRRFGVGVWGKSTPLDLSAISEGYWESRASVDVTMAARATWVEPVGTIETVQGTINSTDFTVVAP